MIAAQSPDDSDAFQLRIGQKKKEKKNIQNRNKKV